MYALFLETESHCYLITEKDFTTLLSSVVDDLDKEDTLDVMQLHITENKVFNEECEEKVLTFLQSLKNEKEI